MTTYEEIWLLIGIGVGLLLFFEGLITYSARLIRCISEGTLKWIVGILILAWAIVKLMNPQWLSNLPPWLSYVVLGLALLILAVVYLKINLSRRKKKGGRRGV